jgi:hypothetical protein
LLLIAIETGELKVKGELNVMQVLTAKLYFAEHYLCELWTGNLDEYFSDLTEYNFSPFLPDKEARKTIYEYISKNINK